MCGPVVVEVSTPPRDEIARITKAVKQVLIQTFVAHSAGEAFHEAILHRLARSIRLDQAAFFTQFRFALMSALASSMSFRMSAVRATFGGFPALIMA